MREILFRGKTEKGEWVEGFYTKGFRYPDEEELHDMIYSFLADEENNEWRFYNAKVIPETIGQFTGLTDKNGKKIFEGDIVKIRRAYLNAGYEEDCFYKVDWHKYWNGWALINIKDTQSCYLDNVIQGEVIGNIHDNPELLGE